MNYTVKSGRNDLTFCPIPIMHNLQNTIAQCHMLNFTCIFPSDLYPCICCITVIFCAVTQCYLKQFKTSFSWIIVWILNSRWYYFQFICHSENKRSNNMAEIVGVVCFCYSEFSLYLFPRWCPGHWIACKCNTMRSCDNVTAVWTFIVADCTISHSSLFKVIICSSIYCTVFSSSMLVFH